jgi:hypothetical protein
MLDGEPHSEKINLIIAINIMLLLISTAAHAAAASLQPAAQVQANCSV